MTAVFKIRQIIEMSQRKKTTDPGYKIFSHPGKLLDGVVCVWKM